MQYKNSNYHQPHSNTSSSNNNNNNNSSHRYHSPQYGQGNCKSLPANLANEPAYNNYNNEPYHKANSNNNNNNNINTCANYTNNSSSPRRSAGGGAAAATANPATNNPGTMMTKQKTSLSDRLNIGDEVRDLKLGCTFNTKNTTTAFHTIKYDFKPASVDKSKVATVDVASNSQVTVTVPNLESSGVPHTVYKGNQRKYTKECLIIYDRKTGDITLEKLSHNIQVKKTRSEVVSKPSVAAPLPAVPAVATSNTTTNTSNSAPPAKLENSTMRISSKTKVSTGSRRNNIIDFKPRNSPMQGSPSSGSVNHRSPQSAPAWNANNTLATLPSIPMITDEYEPPAPADNGPFGGNNAYGNAAANLSNSSASSAASSHNNSASQDYQPQYAASGKQPKHQSHQNNHKRKQHQMQHSPLQHNDHMQPAAAAAATNNRMYTNGGGNDYLNPGQRAAGGGGHNSNSNHGSMHMGHNLSSQPMDYNSEGESPHDMASESLAIAAAALEQQIGVLSSSSSSSESDSSGSESGSESDDSDDEESAARNHTHQQHHHKQTPTPPPNHYSNPMHQLPSLGMALSQSPSPPPPSATSSSYPHHQEQTNFTTNGAYPDLLHNDLQLSNSSDDDD